MSTTAMPLEGGAPLAARLVTAASRFQITQWKVTPNRGDCRAEWASRLIGSGPGDRDMAKP